ncbi:MAG: hypothetical protein LBH84_06675 [Prevotellaceae bacterium]|jgi:hypothetical protein|nr:hypothetical protein [Prevotellaceae bacterium]
MRKLIYITCILAAAVFTSCQKEMSNWYSETFDYSGRFVVATTCDEYEDDNTTIEDGVEVLIYNTAANVGNEIWLDFSAAASPQKGKFKVTGTPAESLCTETAENISSHSYYIDTDYGLAPFDPSYAGYFRVPTAPGEANDGIQLYTFITLDTLKILPGAATSIGGNVVDSIYIKVTLHHDYMEFESREKPVDEWDDPAIPEYEWVVKPNSNTPADADDWDEHWTLAGYRYTGYPEDM